MSTKTEVFWDELRKVLALHGPDALKAEGDVLRLFKSCVLSMWVDASDEAPVSFERFVSLTREHLIGT